ncbi:hypothetical protein B0H11DRAFT_1914957 [Mycena galericulata]|nr:hypothetical protein B0H11DRAFT_1914957 [Mycena galericulata]
MEHAANDFALALPLVVHKNWRALAKEAWETIRWYDFGTWKQANVYKNYGTTVGGRLLPFPGFQSSLPDNLRPRFLCSGLMILSRCKLSIRCVQSLRWQVTLDKYECLAPETQEVYILCGPSRFKISLVASSFKGNETIVSLSTLAVWEMSFTAILRPEVFSQETSYTEACKDSLQLGGSACLSANGRMKVVYNLSSGDFDVYEPADSLIPFSLSVPTETRLIKQCAFAEEDDRTLVCGGDGGTVHIFNLDETQQLESLPAEGPDTFYALTTFSTLDYHFIACGESEEPATIFIWRKTTATRAAEDRRLRKKWQVDRQAAATQSKEKKTRERHRVAGTCQETWQWLWLLAITIAVVGAVSSYILGLGRG